MPFANLLAQLFSFLFIILRPTFFLHFGIYTSYPLSFSFSFEPPTILSVQEEYILPFSRARRSVLGSPTRSDPSSHLHINGIALYGDVRLFLIVVFFLFSHLSANLLMFIAVNYLIFIFRSFFDFLALLVHPLRLLCAVAVVFLFPSLHPLDPDSRLHPTFFIHPSRRP